MPEPRVLPFGVLPGCGLAALRRFLLRPCTAQESSDFRHTYRAQDWTEHGQTSTEQGLNLSDRTVLEHPFEPRVAPPVKRIAVGQEDRRMKRDRFGDAAHALGLPVRERPAGRSDDLECAGDARGVTRVKQRGTKSASSRSK